MTPHDDAERCTARSCDAVAEPAGDPVALVERFLALLMSLELEAARALVSDDLRIRFTGGRPMHDPSECAAYNRLRYATVRKRFGPTELVAGATAGLAIVYQRGTLEGTWRDGTPFDGNRYVDRYEIRHGRIASMEVWNDSAERLLERAGLGPAGTPSESR